MLSLCNSHISRVRQIALLRSASNLAPAFAVLLSLLLQNRPAVLQDNNIVEVLDRDRCAYACVGEMVQRAFELQDVAGRLCGRRVVDPRQSPVPPSAAQRAARSSQ